MSEAAKDQDDGWLSKEVCDAMDGDRHESVKMWGQVALGDFDSEVMLWLKHIAEAVLDAESKPAGRVRDAAIIRAIGLSGTADKHRALRDFVGALKSFDISRKQIIAAARTGQPPAGILLFIDYDPNAYKDIDEADFQKLIDRELAKPDT